MKHLALALFAYAAFGTEAVLHGTTDAAPRLLIVGTVLSVLTCRGTAGVVWAMLFGLLDDALAPGVMGPGVAVHAIAAYVLLPFVREERSSLAGRALVSIVTSAAAATLLPVVRRLIESPTSPNVPNVLGNPLALVWTAVAALLAVLGAQVIGRASHSRRWSSL